MTPAQKESYEWFKSKIKNYQTSSQKKSDIEYTKMERRKIGSGSFVTFNYKNPVGKAKGTLKFFDEHPVNVIIGIRGNDALMLNFHYCPKPFRPTVIQQILKLNKSNIQQDERLELTYQIIKEFIVRNGLSLMIHRYKVNRITNLEYVKGSEIKYIVNLPSEKFNILNPDMTEEDLYKLIMSQSTQTKKSKNVRVGRPTK